MSSFRVPPSKAAFGASSTSRKATAPSSPAKGCRWPSFFYLASVNMTRKSGGISSLMFVTITFLTLVPARAAFATG